MTADMLLTLARGELGMTERPAGSNKVKYNTAYYGREVSGAGYPWCCTFVWWLFQQAGASALFYGGGRTAYCPTLLTYHKKQGVRGDYRPGDVIFFNFSGKTSAAHVGICEKWDGEYITTIDGNTGSGNEANGGAVMRRTRHKKYIVGAYRPAYEEEEILTQLQFDNLMADWLARQSERPESPWGKMPEAKRLGITDGTRPQSFATREEVATMIVSAKM
ncbi:MAG: CHAP domain-containing protein [Oscillospiraceae bacterium]|nr:CHAP domain-containing protein [Oscillospiraceae bacterium]